MTNRKIMGETPLEPDSDEVFERVRNAMSSDRGIGLLVPIGGRLEGHVLCTVHRPGALQVHVKPGKLLDIDEEAVIEAAKKLHVMADRVNEVAELIAFGM